jgi:hypothetical protein
MHIMHIMHITHADPPTAVDLNCGVFPYLEGGWFLVAFPVVAGLEFVPATPAPAPTTATGSAGPPAAAAATPSHFVNPFTQARSIDHVCHPSMRMHAWSCTRMHAWSCSCAAVLVALLLLAVFFV